jgi:hypothetical protein
MLTPAQVAELTGFKVQTLAAWRTGRGGPGPRFHKFGRTVRYKYVDLVEWASDKAFRNTVEARFARSGQILGKSV